MEFKIATQEDIISLHTGLVGRWQSRISQLGYQAQNAHSEIKLILRHYTKKGRYYHTTDHLVFLFQEFDRNSKNIFDKDRIFFAIWYHDLIYNVWRKDNERASAKHAQKALLNMGMSKQAAAAIYNTIVATAFHDDPETDEDDRLFLDMDMAILGSPASTYDQYVIDVRKEYAAIPAPIFNKGRKAFLKTTLEKSAIFLTDPYKKRLDSQARENLSRELSSL